MPTPELNIKDARNLLHFSIYSIGSHANKAVMGRIRFYWMFRRNGVRYKSDKALLLDALHVMGEVEAILGRG